MSSSLDAQRFEAEQAGRPQVDETDPRIIFDRAMALMACADAARRLGQSVAAARFEAEARALVKGARS